MNKFITKLKAKKIGPDEALGWVAIGLAAALLLSIPIGWLITSAAHAFARCVAGV